MTAFEDTYKELKKRYGYKLSLGKDAHFPGKLPTGSLALDMELGGWPQGKITTINGRHSVAKTATAFHAVKQAQTLYPNKPCVWIAVEPFDREWAQTNGVDLNKLIVVEPETGEDAINIHEGFLMTRECSLMVLDSLGALAPAYELDHEAENGMQNTRAKLVKRLLLKTNARLKPSKDQYNDCVCLFLNHIYETIDMKSYAIAGGTAVMMQSSLCVTFSRKEYLWEGEEKKSEKIGLKIGVKIEKDKTQGEGQGFEFQYFNKNGWAGTAVAGNFDNVDAVINYGQLLPSPESPLITRTGGWYNIGGEKVQGKEGVRKLFMSNMELLSSITNTITSVKSQ